MNKMKIGIIGVSVAIALLLISIIVVSVFNEKSEDTERMLQTANTKIELYEAQIIQLEKEVEGLKEAQYLSSSAYEEKIAELKSELEKDRPSENIPTEDDARYTYTVANNAVALTGYEGSVGILTVPEYIDGLPVETIGREAFKGADCTEVVLPERLKKIDWFAFSSCELLKKVYIPSSVSKIEYGAFDGADRIVIVCVKDSYAYKYARSYGLDVEIREK